MEKNEIAIKVCEDHERRKGELNLWATHWDEVAKYVVPKKDNVYGQAVVGEKRGNRLFDTEAILATDELAAAFSGLLTSPSITWFGLTSGMAEKDSDIEVSRWLHDTVRTMLNVINGSNFHTEIVETYTDLGSIGTNLLRIEEDDEDVVRFHSDVVYDVTLAENSKGVVDTVSRKFEFDLRQLEMEYGDAFTPEEWEKISKDPKAKFKIIHEVSPRSKLDRARAGSMGFGFRSIHVLEKERKILREGGYEEFPYAVPRFSKCNGELYGRSPAMKALADIKMINAMKKVTIQGAQLAILPPLQAPDTGFLAPLRLEPASVNYRRNVMDKAEPLFTGARPDIGLDLVQDTRAIIRKHFMLDKLQTPMLDRMTATEIIQRRDEMFRMLGPLLGRTDRELLKPVIDRVYKICERKGLLKPAPDALKSSNGKLTIKYLSPIAQAQMATQSENIVRAISATGSVIQMQPEIVDNIDGDKLLRHNFEIFNVDPKVLRTQREVKQLREARQAALAEQKRLEATQVEAEAVSKLGGTLGEETERAGS